MEEPTISSHATGVNEAHTVTMKGSIFMWSMLRDIFCCRAHTSFAPIRISLFDRCHCFHIVDGISLVENNVVFPLNGKWLRKQATLLYSYHTARDLEGDIKPPTQDYLPRQINDFLLDLAVRR
jgi:hypothetical protein